MPVQQGDPTVASAFSPGREYDGTRRETCQATPPRDPRSRSPEGPVHGAGQWLGRPVTGLSKGQPVRSMRAVCDSPVRHLSPAWRPGEATHGWCDRRRPGKHSSGRPATAAAGIAIAAHRCGLGERCALIRRIRVAFLPAPGAFMGRASRAFLERQRRTGGHLSATAYAGSGRDQEESLESSQLFGPLALTLSQRERESALPVGGAKGEGETTEDLSQLS